ncbi:hypothetical protein BHE74_00017648 [Ensete ventricosum]|nr:hypothetical protein BHE74_00017648 [Ensete ventricosum]
MYTLHYRLTRRPRPDIPYCKLGYAAFQPHIVTAKSNIVALSSPHLVLPSLLPSNLTEGLPTSQGKVLQSLKNDHMTAQARMKQPLDKCRSEKKFAGETTTSFLVGFWLEGRKFSYETFLECPSSRLVICGEKDMSLSGKIRKVCNRNRPSAVVGSVKGANRREEPEAEKESLLPAKESGGVATGRRKKGSARNVQWNDCRGENLVEYMCFYEQD